MKPAGIKYCCGLAAVLAVLSVSADSAYSAENDQHLEAADVATNFIKAFTSTEQEDLFEYIADPFTFEGRVVKGQEQISLFIKEQLKDTRAELLRHPDARVEVFSYQAAVSRFGKPPRKFRHLKLRSCLFAAVSYEKRHGFLMILKKNKKEGWRVTALTD